MAFYGAAKRVCVFISRNRSYSSSASSENVNRIKQLRERTSAPIKDVKAALVDSNWDIDAAQKELRKKGKSFGFQKILSNRLRRFARPRPNPAKVALIELNCEIDFVARNTFSDTWHCVWQSKHCRSIALLLLPLMSDLNLWM
ncbi:elongation factor Ts, mitochondrial-like isoform X2 [Vigna unguiculata]|uniref:elongation factor Ts, mitochondrial-like isoform X2 n=1 Tax=Vigna unguiculata TaxID=3917 RepID=UPI00101689C1|nr:elongation factor Ts, mitochondrial-like isoform X2 [Vigna unguiculata]